MAVHIHAQVVLQAASGIPADNCTNSWNFYTPVALDPDDIDNIRDIIKDFYTKDWSGSGKVADFFSKELSDTALIKYYNMGDPKPRVPIRTDTFTLGRPPSGNALPSECALVFSFQAERESGQNQARRRNRIYLGPLNTGAADSNGRPSSSFMALLAVAGSETLQASNASITWQWRVYSPTTGNTHLVDNGWIDNAFDTQRRRGVAPTTRTLWDDSTP